MRLVSYRCVDVRSAMFSYVEAGMLRSNVLIFVRFRFVRYVRVYSVVFR